MGKTKIHVIMRMTPDSRAPQSGIGSRPSWYDKESVFRSVFLTKDADTEFTIVFDGDPRGHWIYKYSIKELIPIQGGTDKLSLANMLHITMNMSLPDNDIIYFLEDDYLHKKGWCDLLREGLSKRLMPNNIKFDYITLYDHYDKYYFNDEYTKQTYAELTSRIAVSKSTHWRTIPSTTNTYAMRVKTFMDDIDIHMFYKNIDNDKFIELGKNYKRVIASCVPGWSTHCHNEFLSPCVDWESVFRQNTL
jgi:hypothetical protein